jgi:hypothetical protein
MIESQNVGRLADYPSKLFILLSFWRAENDETENYVYAIALHAPPK